MSTIERGSLKKISRTAGVLYLIVVVTGIFSLAYVPSQINVDGDASATVVNILALEPLFRYGIVAGLVCYTAFLILPLALYKLLSPVNTNAAVLMVAFAVTQVPVFFVNLRNKLEVLSLLSGAEFSSALTNEQLHTHVMLSLAAYSNGMLVSEIFMGLWLLPLGYLVFKSGFLPKLLGIFLVAGCFGYLIDFSGRVLFPGYLDTSLPNYITLPAAIGEIGTCLWLLIVGARMPPQSSRPATEMV